MTWIAIAFTLSRLSIELACAGNSYMALRSFDWWQRCSIVVELSL